MLAANTPGCRYDYDLLSENDHAGRGAIPAASGGGAAGAAGGFVHSGGVEPSGGRAGAGGLAVLSGGTTGAGGGAGSLTDLSGGTTGSGASCVLGRTRSCDEGGLVGSCATGTQSCGADGTWSACTIAPKAGDTCVEGNDDDCDGVPNEGCPCLDGHTQPCGDGPQVGICRKGESLCTRGAWGPCQGSVYPATRDCRSADDNDCNGMDDSQESPCTACVPDNRQACDTHPQDGKGVCQPGSQICVESADHSIRSWDACTGSVGPSSEICDGGRSDENCDGNVNEGCCPATGGPSMVYLPEGYCIDSTEVTRGQYEAWLNGTPTPSTSDQISVCVSNGTFAPDASCMGSSQVCQGTGCVDHPQACVDWCDAYAYCHAVGKRLCGKIGGGANEYAAYSDITQSQWHNACTSHGANDFPFGDTCDAQLCNGLDYSGTSYMTLAVGWLSGCQSSSTGYSNVYDLSGNLAEWEDSCDGPGEAAYCRLRGGSFCDRSIVSTCGHDLYVGRSSAYLFTGFRCCSG